MKPPAENRAPAGSGFSLVEVALSLGIAAFALVVLLGLIPVGMQSSRDSVEETHALAVLRAVVADRRAAPSGSNSVLYNLPPLSTTTATTLFINEDGTMNDTAAGARYQVIVTPRVPTPPPAPAVGVNPTFLLLHASWPAAATVNPSSVEILAAFPP